MRVWDLATGAPIGEPFTGHPGGVRSVAVTPDGTRIITGGEDGWVRVHEVSASGAPAELIIVSDHARDGGSIAMTSMAVTPDGTRIITGSSRGTVLVWDLATGTPVGEPLTGHTGGARSVAVTPDGTRIITSSVLDGAVRVWDLATGAPIGEPLTGHTGDVTSMAVTPDGTWIVTSGVDGAVRVWDLATGSEVEPLTRTATSARRPGLRVAVAATPHGERVVSVDDLGTILVWAPFGKPGVDVGPGVVTDAEAGADLLDLTSDVQTVAAVLAATATAPPLSIALMGNWGSGKSTFMRLLIAEVTRLSSADRRGVYVRQVRQVRFNAWHYSDDHLWVGLIEQLFDQLRDKPSAAAESTESLPAHDRST